MEILPSSWFSWETSHPRAGWGRELKCRTTAAGCLWPPQFSTLIRLQGPFRACSERAGEQCQIHWFNKHMLSKLMTDFHCCRLKVKYIYLPVQNKIIIKLTLPDFSLSSLPGMPCLPSRTLPGIHANDLSGRTFARLAELQLLQFTTATAAFVASSLSSFLVSGLASIGPEWLARTG